jgi:hypothetical protein
MDLETVCKKYGEALNSADTSEATAVRRALNGLAVDWTLWFKSAEIDSNDERNLVVILFKPARPPALSPKYAIFNIPAKGNEWLTHLKDGYRIQVRGTIRSVGFDTVFLNPEVDYEIR